MSSRSSTTSSALGAVLAVVAAATLVATLPGQLQPDVPTVGAVTEPVARAVLACPPGRGGGTAGIGATTGDATGEVGGGPAAGRVEVTVEQPGDRTRRIDVRRGALASTPVGPGGVMLRADGSSARGLVAARRSAAPRGDVRGPLAVAGCATARPAWWFAGAGGGVDHSSVLFLTNVDEGPAVVDVRLHGAAGSVDEAGTRGLTLAPGEVLRLPLDEVAPGSEELTVEVVATRGRVVAHVEDRFRVAEAEGREWLPPAEAPAADVVLAGVPNGADRATLLVTNPGEEQTRVGLEVQTPDGAFVPLGSEEVSVPPGSIAEVDLTKALEGRPAAVRLTSEVPVTGAVRATLGDDVAYAGAVPGTTAPAAAVLTGERSELLVATGDEPASLQLTVHASDGRQLVRRGVTVAGSGLVRVRLPAAAALAVLVPRSGDAHVALVHSGAGVAGQPVTPVPTTVLRPPVRPAILAEVAQAQSDS